MLVSFYSAQRVFQSAVDALIYPFSVVVEIYVPFQNSNLARAEFNVDEKNLFMIFLFF